MAPPGAQGQAEMAPVVAFVAASKTGTRPVAMSTGGCPLPLESMGCTRNTGGGWAGRGAGMMWCLGKQHEYVGDISSACTIAGGGQAYTSLSFIHACCTTVPLRQPHLHR